MYLGFSTSDCYVSKGGDVPIVGDRALLEDQGLCLEVRRLVTKHPGDNEGHKVSDYLTKISSMMLPCLTLSIIMAYSSDTVFLLKGLGLSHRNKDICTSNIREHVYFFPNLRRSQVHVNLSTNI